MIEYTPTQIVRSHFDEITDWRVQGISWAQISEELHLTDKNTNVSTLRAIYQYERQRRTTPQYRTALCWVAAHQQEIAELRARGFSWLDVISMTPSQESAGDSTSPPKSVVKPPYKMLIEVYTSITERAPAHSASFPVPQTNRDLASIKPAAVTQSHYPPTQQSIQALTTEHESSVIRILSRRARLMQVVRATLDQTHLWWSRSKDNGHVN
jgi:sensor c-di-GMP phosphodiesterase-like protein